MRVAGPLLVWLASLTLLACDAGRAEPPRRNASETAPAPRSAAVRSESDADYAAPDGSGWGRAGELRYLEQVLGAADAGAPLPMVVMIHGLGDAPRNVWLAEPVDPAVRLIMPRAPLPYHGGYSWFENRVADDQPRALARGVARASDQLARTLQILARRRPTLGRPIVGGFSQGGMLSYALAVRHPEVVEVSHPISGMLPRPLWPRQRPAGRVPPIRASHGNADRVVPIEAAQALVSHLIRLGYDARLEEFPGVPHRISRAMSARLREVVLGATGRVRELGEASKSRGGM
ncbi:MAG: dienelactone hydrolase family protein [Myxococcales bacterium]|jgi:phospholipase/carboxylesterase